MQIFRLSQLPPSGMWTATILGEPASKANSRRLVTIKGRPASIKSAKALAWTEAAIVQLRAKRPVVPFTTPVVLGCTIYYASERPDLDESLVCDALQKAGWVTNDRLIRERHTYHRIDRANPRVELSMTARVAA